MQGKTVNVMDAMTKANTKNSNKQKASPARQSPNEQDDSYEEDEFFDGEEETSKEIKRSN